MAEVRRIDAPGARPATIREGILEAIAAAEGVERVVAFPDPHQKPDEEIPSSVAVATSDTFAPNFSKLMTRMPSLGRAPSRIARKYACAGDSVNELSPPGDAGMGALVDTLDREGVLRPLAELAPLATIKV